MNLTATKIPIDLKKNMPVFFQSLHIYCNYLTIILPRQKLNVLYKTWNRGIVYFYK